MQKHLRKLNVLLKYTTAAIIISVALYPKFPFIKVPGTFVAVRLEDFLLLFCGFLVSVYLYQNRKTVIKDRLFRAIIIYVIIGSVSVISAIFLTKTVSPLIGILHLLRRIEYFVAIFIGFYYIKNFKIDFVYKLTIITLLFVFIYGLGQRFLNWPIIITQNMEYSKGVALRWVPGSHINSTFAGHYDLASWLVLLLPMIILLFITTKDKFIKIISFISIFGGLWLLVNSASRISLVSYLSAISISLFFLKKYKLIPIVITISILFIVFSGNLVSRYKRFFDVAVERIKVVSVKNYLVSAKTEIIIPSYKSETPTPSPVFEDRSTNIRLNVEWPRAIRAFFKNPLLGTGYSSISLATDNDYLRSLGETGVFGFLSFSLIFFVILKKFYIRKNDVIRKYSDLETIFVVGLVGSILGIFINAFFIDIFEASKFAIYYWLYIGFLWGIIDNYDKNI